MGTGYVYSDKYIDDDKALEQFKKHIGQDDLEFKKIKMRIGIHKRLWVKNVCAVGLSAGFIEPLESNGLLTIHTFLIKLIPILKKNIVSEFTKEHYNWSNRRMFRNFAEFVAMHYYLSNRVDTEYWQDIQKRKINMEFESDIQRAMTDKMERGSWTSTGGFPCIATGMNWFPTTLEETMYYNRNSNLDFWKNEFKSTEVHLNNRKQHFKEIAQKEPYLFDFLQERIYGG